VDSETSPVYPLIVVLGPTGSGKTELSLRLAERWNGEIISCDSVQVYRGFDIGSAKLPVSERHGIPHHLLDIATVGEEFTAGDYSRLARTALGHIRDAKKIPIVCGGTGFYLRAFLCGLSPAPPRHPALRDRLSAIARRRPTTLHHLLSRIDPKAAGSIHPNDHQKLIRALEMSCIEKSTASDIQSRPRDSLTGFEILRIGLNPDRQQLYGKLNARSADMFGNGLIEETAKLLESGHSPQSMPMQSLGYRQAVSVLSNNISVEQAVADCQAKTRQYAKRQLTWFRAEPDVNWFAGFGNDPSIQREAIALSQEFITKSSLKNYL
jgi:tRNA dimethylallyltransferase